MKKQLLTLTVSLAMVGFAGAAQAEGCLKGAAVGGVAGHVAGHHGKLGAAGGCAVGHHSAKKKDKEAAAAQTAPAADAGNQAAAPAAK